MSVFDACLDELRAARDVTAAKDAAQTEAARSAAQAAHFERMTPSLTIYVSAILNVANMQKSLDFASVFGKAEATIIDADRIHGSVCLH